MKYLGHRQGEKSAMSYREMGRRQYSCLPSRWGNGGEQVYAAEQKRRMNEHWKSGICLKRFSGCRENRSRYRQL